MTERSEEPRLADEEYFLEVESHFAERRGTPFIFSAKDWALLKGWRTSGIPLSIVIEAIDLCFDKRQERGRHRTISSLSYCRHAVRELWEERKDLHVGGGTEVPEADPRGRLSELAEDLERSAAECSDAAVTVEISEAAARIRRVSSSASVPSIEQALMDLEEELLDRIQRVASPELSSQIEAGVDRELERYAFSDPEIRSRTRAANIRRRTRSLLSLPRLSLFG